MKKANIYIDTKSDFEFLTDIGNFIKSNRLSKNLTQLELAERSDVNRGTVSALESGKSVTLINLIQILRTLGKLDVLNTMQYTEEVSPLKVAKLAAKQRKRASGLKFPDHKNTTDW